MNNSLKPLFRNGPCTFYLAFVLFLGWLGPALADLQVNTHQANLRSEPGLEGNVIAVAKVGENVQAEAYRNRYVRVRTASGKIGWVYGPAQNWSEAQITAAVRTTTVPAQPIARPVPQPVARPAAVATLVAKAPAVAPRVVATTPAAVPAPS